MKHVPQRTCIACREQKDRSDLVRIVRKTDGTIELDIKGREDGRGAYICKNTDCMRTAVKKRALNKAYKESVSDQTYDRLLEQFDSYFGNTDER